MKDWKGRVYSFEFTDPSRPIRTFRSRKPCHFIFEIESYQELMDSLNKANLKAFETPEFTVGNDTWTLCIYPNGNVAKGGQGHLSLYLKRHNAGANRSKEATVSMKFFILDQYGGEYLVIEDLGEKAFDMRGREWGLPQVLEISHFTNEGNGFLLDNSCTFGVEVYVTNGEPHYSKMTLVKTIARRSFDVSFNLGSAAFPDQPLESSTFVSTFDDERYTWKLRLYRTEYAEGTDSHMSLFLVLVDKTKVSNGRNMLVNFELSLKSKLTGQDVFPATKQDWFTDKKGSVGFPKFIEVREFYTSNLGLVTGGFLDAKVVFNTVFTLSDI